MAKKFIVIEISENPNTVPDLADWKEVMFNLGVGPEEEWPNTVGYAYTVKRVNITDEEPVMTNPERYM